MASGTFSKQFATYWTLIVNWSSVANVSGNYSTVTMTAYLRTPALSIGSRTCTANIGGYEQTFTAPAIDKETQTAENILLGTVTQNVPHNSDGTKTVSMSLKYPINARLNNVKYSSVTAKDENCVLDSIPRASSVTATPETGLYLRLGEAFTTTVYRAVSTYTDVVKFYINGTYVSGSDLSFTTATSALQTLPASAGSLFSVSSQTATLTVSCTTYSGSTVVGTKSAYYTIYIATSAAPAVTATFALVDGYNSNYLRSRSKVQAAPTVTTQYGATVSSYTLTVGTAVKVSNASPVTSDVITESGELTVTVTVLDSRGLSGSASTTITVLDYSAPTIIPNGGTDVLCVRCDSQGNITDIGEYLYVQAIANYTNITGNSVTFTYAVKAAADPSYPAATAFASNIVDGIVSGVALSTATTYNVLLTATDTVGGSATFTAVVSKTVPTFHLKDGGAGAAFGKVAETDNLLDIAWDVRIRGNLTVDGSGGGGGSSGTVFTATLSSNTATLSDSKTLQDVYDAYNGGQNEVFILVGNYKFRVSTAYIPSSNLLYLLCDAIVAPSQYPILHYLYVPSLSLTGNQLQYSTKTLT